MIIWIGPFVVVIVLKAIVLNVIILVCCDSLLRKRLLLLPIWIVIVLSIKTLLHKWWSKFERNGEQIYTCWKTMYMLTSQWPFSVELWFLNSKHYSCKNDSTCKFLRECLFQYCQRTQKPSFARLYDEDKLVPINGTPMIIYDRNKERIRELYYCRLCDESRVHTSFFYRLDKTNFIPRLLNAVLSFHAQIFFL